MSFTEFQCPACSARLRMRDRNQLQRTIPCPDCGERLTLEADGPDNVIAVVPSIDSATPAKTNNGIRGPLNPRVVAFIVAVLVLMTLGLVVFGPGDNDQQDDSLADAKGVVNATKPPGTQRPDAEGQSPAESTTSNEDPPAGLPEIPDPPPSQAPDMSDLSGPNNPTRKTDLTEPVPAESHPVVMDPVVEDPITEPDPSTETPMVADPAELAELEQKRLAKLALRLGQPILVYEQPQPVALSRLLLEWEELSGMEVRFSDTVSDDVRQQPIALQLKDTTVQDILLALLAEAKLVSRKDAESIVIDAP